MRVTMTTMYDRIKTDLSRITERLDRTNSTISSGKIYQTPSDAPVRLTHALGLRDNLADIDQFKRNITYGQGWVKATENALTGVQDRLQRAKELAIEGANDTQNKDNRRAIAQEVKNILEEVVSLGNSKLGNRYLFGGSRTTGYDDGELPFELDRDGNVVYNGNLEDIRLDVAPGIKQQINLDGKTTFVDSGTFDALRDLYDGLMADSQPDIENAIKKLDDSMTYISNQTARIGAMANSLDVKEDLMDSQKIINTEILSGVEDTDLIEAINDLNATQTAYQAALGAASKVMQVSLADYI
ncbi:MAG: flagellar hook-associated protein 3 [Thermodesulfobacteria bacterium]|nr:flagellar hook-associated protein 3 [Thermodesulfobacteriota bacterium]